MSVPSKVKIFYLASGHISIPILEALLKADNLEIAGIGSQKKAAKNNGGPARSANTPLVKYCAANNIPIQCFESVNTPDFYAMLTELGVEMLVVASFGQLLKETVLNLPPFGCLNVHASLLPKYRGASPVIAAILAGDKKAGITFMKMDKGLDTGPMYQSCELDILPDDNAYTLEQRLGELAGNNIANVIADIARNGKQPVPQPENCSSYAKKISKGDGQICWDKDAAELANMVRAYSPWPSVTAKIPVSKKGAASGDYRNVKITKAIQLASVHPDIPGTVLAFGREGIVVACGNNSLRIERLVPEGKKEMSAGDYLLGNPIPQDAVCK